MKKRAASDSQPIVIFCDGACTGNPGPGGWGAIIAMPDGTVTELGGFEADTTNNRMELTAAGKALRHLEEVDAKIALYTDSAYVINGITKWVWGWRQRGWKTAEGKDVANAEYWKRLMAIVAQRKNERAVEFKYVPGHAGVPGNERADEIAVAYAKGKRIALYRGPLLKYEIPIFDLPDDVETPSPKPKAAPKAAAHCYLSLVGGVLARHATWAECERRVKGVPGAKFKRCASADEERAVLDSWGVKSPG